MTLRTRLLVAYLAVVVVLGTALVVVARGQRDHLVDQIDRELSAVRPFVVPQQGADLPAPQDGGGPVPVDGADGPISTLYIAEIALDGSVVARLRGVLLDDTPDLGQLDLTEVAADGARTLVTLDGLDGGARFRAAVQLLPNGSVSVVALPLDEVDDAVDRLVLALSIAAALVLLAMALSTWWVIRLGLRPISRMTDAAGEIAAGKRDRRVDDDDPRTEVGRLGLALNDMLDHRDRSEDKLRQFVADASHELRTPLTSIRGGLDLALDEALAPDRREEVLRRVRAESRRMHDLVEDLLLLASIDSGRPLRAEEVDLVAVMHDAADDALALQPARRVVVDPARADTEHVPVVVCGDEMRLRQVVAGLVHNALAHTPTDATLRLGVRREPTSVLLEVADDGPGLTADAAATAFDRFVRGDGSRSRHAGGAGLGLAIARSIVEAHGGRLDLATAPGHGCTFTLRLPR